MTDLATIDRKVSEIKQSVVALHRLRPSSGSDRASGPRTPPGERFFLKAAADLARMAGNAVLAEKLETRAAVTVATTTGTGWASELSKPGGVGAYIMGQQQSAIAAVLRRSPQVSLLGAGQLRIPVATAPAPATIVAESMPIPVVKGSVASAVMAPWKVAAILTASQELLDAGNAEQLLRAMLAESVSAGLDLAAFSATPPAGLLAGLVAVAPSTGGANLGETIAGDLAKLLAAMTNPSTETVFAVSPPGAALASALVPGLAYAVVPSSALPKGTIVALDPLGVAASLPSEARTSTVEGAAIHEESAPAPIVDAAGTAAKPVRSLWQTSTWALKTVFETAWQARPGAVAFMTGATW